MGGARALVSCIIVLSSFAPNASAEDLEDLAWLAGGWRTASENGSVEEHWIPPTGGMMLAVGRFIVDGKAVAFEFLRIEQRGEAIVYTAQPNGKPGTEFHLTELSGESAVFENPEHDHPKILRYRRSGDSLHIEVEGDEGKSVFELEAQNAPEEG